MTPFFSIIIPVYNVAPYLRECLDSVLAQTLTDWEAICVDDGSTDGSGAILDEYAAKDKRFRVIHQKNAGVSAARNKALDEALGDWICFLDGDDVWNERLLCIFASGINEYPRDICFRMCSSQFYGDADRPKFNVQGCSFKKIDISKTISMPDFYSYYFYCYLYKRELFDGVRFPHYIRGEDRCVLNRLQLQNIDAIVATGAVLYGYRRRVGSAMNSLPSLQVLCDEMDHRLDIMEMIDSCSKKVVYAGNHWLEGYFIDTLPLLTLERPDDAGEIKAEWRKRLPRLLKCKGLSRKGWRRIYLSRSLALRPIGDFILYTLPRLRRRSELFKPVASLYRRIMRHGEFARGK